MSYNRELAVNYALKWALDRNPLYYNYDKIGRRLYEFYFTMFVCRNESNEL